MEERNCIFCEIAKGNIPAETIYEDKDFRVILDVAPATRGHALILPKMHGRDLTEIPEELCGKAFFLAGKLGKIMMEKLGAAGFNVVQNNGIEAGQTVFHFHIHVIPRYENGPHIVLWETRETDGEEQRKIAGTLRASIGA